MTDWLYNKRFLAVALGLVLAQFLFRWWWAEGGYFWQDDFRYLARTADGLSVDILFQNYNGHLMPGSFVMSRLLVALGSSYAVALTLLLAFQAAASLLLVWVVDLLFPRRLLSLVVLAAAMFTPLTLVGLTWYAYGLQLWPIQIALLACIGGYVKWRRTGSRAWLLMVLVMYLFGLFFWQKALLIPGALVLLAVLVLDREIGVKARLTGLLRQWELWLPMVAITACYVALYLDITSGGVGDDAPAGEGGRGSEDGLALSTFLNNGLVRTLLPGLLGGPWTDSGSMFTISATPSSATTFVAVVIWVGLLAIGLVRRPATAAKAWLAVIVFVAINYAILVLLRPGAEDLVRDSRYIADSIPMIVLGLLASLLPLRGQREEVSSAEARLTNARAAVDSFLRSRVFRVRTAAVVGVVVLIGGVYSTVIVGDQLRHTGSRLYVSAVERSIASDPDRPLLDDAAPFPSVFFGNMSEVSKGLGLPATFIENGQGLSMFDTSGSVRPVGIRSPTFQRKGPREGCGWLLTARSPVEVDTAHRQIPWPQRVLQIGYYGKQPAAVTVEVDGARRAQLTAADGLGNFTLRANEVPKTVRLTVQDPKAALCITELAIGIATPAGS